MDEITRFAHWAGRPLRAYAGSGSMHRVHAYGDPNFDAMDEERGFVTPEELLAHGWDAPEPAVTGDDEDDEEPYDTPLPLLPLLGELSGSEADWMLSTEGAFDVCNLLIEMPCGTNLYGADLAFHGRLRAGVWLAVRVELSQPSGFGPCETASAHLGLWRSGNDTAVFVLIPNDRAALLALMGLDDAALADSEALEDHFSLGG